MSTEAGREEADSVGVTQSPVHARGRHPLMHRGRGSVVRGRAGKDGVQEFEPHLGCWSPSDVNSRDADLLALEKNSLR